MRVKCGHPRAHPDVSLTAVEPSTTMTCVACRRDAPTVSDAEIAELRSQVPDWELVELDGIRRL